MRAFSTFREGGLLAPMSLGILSPGGSEGHPAMTRMRSHGRSVRRCRRPRWSRPNRSATLVVILGVLKAACHQPAPPSSGPREFPAGADLAQLEPEPVFRIDRAPEDSAGGWWPWSPPRGTERWRVWARDSSFQALVQREGAAVAVFLPQLDGTERVSSFLTRRLSAEGYQTVAVLPPSRALTEGASRSELVWALKERVRVGRLAVRLAREELGASCVGLIGLSFGAIAAIPVAALERTDSVVAMLGGGDLEWILEHSADPSLRALDAGSTAPSLAREAALVEPLHWARDLPSETALVVAGRWDTSVPFAAAEALLNALPSPHRYFYPTGHYSFALALPHALSAAARHMASVCAKSSGPITVAGGVGSQE